jgi:hypothetical protein
MPLAEIGLVPFMYVVADASSTVTFCPVGVVIVKLAGDTLSTAPDDPPSAGPDRALDPPLAGAACPDGAEEVTADDTVVAKVDTAAVGADVPQPAASPITPDISAATMIHRLFLPESSRPALGRRACSAMVTAADESSEDADEEGGAEPSASGGSDVAPAPGRAGAASWELVRL